MENNHCCGTTCRKAAARMELTEVQALFKKLDDYFSGRKELFGDEFEKMIADVKKIANEGDLCDM